MLFKRSAKFDNDIDVQSMMSNLARLQALENTGLVGEAHTRPELDELTRQASVLLGVRRAMVSLVDDKLQYGANRFDENGFLTKQSEQTLDYSYCKYVVAYNDVVAVEDATIDPLVKDNLATTEDGLRSYLGVPLRSGGEIIGSFCVFDDKPRQWSIEDLDGLENLAGQVMTEIEANLSK